MKSAQARAKALAAAHPDKLRKRERAAMAMAYAMAFDSSAFSIAFDIKPKTVRTIIYLSQPSRNEKEDDPEPEDDDGKEDDDAGNAPAPAPADRELARGHRLERETQPVKPPSAPPKSSQAGGKTSTPAKGAPKGSPKGGYKVDKNALSARAGSPKGLQGQSLADRLDALDARDSAQTDDVQMSDHDDGNSKKPRREICYIPWKAPMLKANRGPPPPDPNRHGDWTSAKAAGLEYGDPTRLVWVRTADRKAWEAGPNDGDHLRGYNMHDGHG